LNHLNGIESLANRYFVLRHGRSLANEQGLIVSHPDNGLDNYGLSTTGFTQIELCLAPGLPLDRATRIISSDYKRARESAEIVHRLLDCASPLDFDQRLRERYFGELELGCDTAYAQVWQRDAANADDCSGSAESANEVMTRVSGLVAQCEELHSGVNFLFVSHGDALQILQAAFAAIDASLHRSLKHLETAEIREMRRQ